MNILSLFDGISAGQVALCRAGIVYENYYASEIDRYAIAITQHNFPKTIQIGDVTKWRQWNIDYSAIDLVMAGFPCQSWSLAGKQQGDDDARGALFWTMLDVMATVLKANPNAKYLIENVKMKKSFDEYITSNITQALGKCNKHLIDSALVSAQSRKRLYWSNIDGIEQPQDRGILLKDVLLDSNISSLYLTETTALKYKPNTKYTKDTTKSCVIGKLSNYQGDRVFDTGCKASSLSAGGGNNGGGGCNIIIDPRHNKLRKLSVGECELLQCFPVGYVSSAKPSQSYKALGNSWTVDVVAHILSYIKEQN